MKLSGAKKVRYDSGPNMTPLVDVVMVILIFLMLAGSFGGVEHYLASNIPLSSKGAGGVPKKAFDDEVIIDVRVDAAIENPNAWVAKFGDVRTASPAELKKAMEDKRVAYEKNGTKADKLQVIINPNRLVKWKSLIAVYAAANDAGYSKIAFSQAH